MRKVKDLVSVSVDNAFVNYPIDRERYELLATVAVVADHYLQEDRGPFDFTQLGCDVNLAYVKQVGDLFFLGAMALARWVSRSSAEEIPSSVEDRAARTLASLHGTHMADLRGPRALDLNDLMDEIQKCLWMKFFICLARATRRQQLSR